MIDWSNFKGFFTTGIPSNVLYPSLLVTGLILIVVLIWKRENYRSYVLWIMLIEYTFIVVCSTILFRATLNVGFDRLELTPFWTYKAVIMHMRGVSVWDIILNVVLFLPQGFLVKLIWSSVSIIKMLLIALLCSLIIETNQYLFEKGVVQFDDMMHNVIGALMGWFLACGILAFKNRKVTR